MRGTILSYCFNNIFEKFKEDLLRMAREKAKALKPSYGPGLHNKYNTIFWIYTVKYSYIISDF